MPSTTTENLKLFVVLLGCKPEGRNTEQHDIFIGVAKEIKDLIPDMEAFWPGVKLHIDGYIGCNYINNHRLSFVTKSEDLVPGNDLKLYFINLGGYKEQELEEYHRKLLIVADNLPAAVAEAKKDSFYKDGQTLDISGGSHVDDKEEIDDIICISQVLPNYKVVISGRKHDIDDYYHCFIGYLPFSKL